MTLFKIYHRRKADYIALATGRIKNDAPVGRNEFIMLPSRYLLHVCTQPAAAQVAFNGRRAVCAAAQSAFFQLHFQHDAQPTLGPGSLYQEKTLQSTLCIQSRGF